MIRNRYNNLTPNIFLRNRYNNLTPNIFLSKQGKRKVHRVPQSQATALPRHQEEERKRKQTKPNKRKSNKHTKNTKISSLFPKRSNDWEHKKKITQDVKQSAS